MLLEGDDAAGHHPSSKGHEDSHTRSHELLPLGRKRVGQQLWDRTQRGDIDKARGLHVVQYSAFRFNNARCYCMRA